jgi:hypothetical protein
MVYIAFKNEQHNPPYVDIFYRIDYLQWPSHLTFFGKHIHDYNFCSRWFMMHNGLQRKPFTNMSWKEQFSHRNLYNVTYNELRLKTDIPKKAKWMNYRPTHREWIIDRQTDYNFYNSYEYYTCVYYVSLLIKHREG